MSKEQKKKSELDYNEDDERTLGEDILDFVKVFVICAIIIMVFINFIAYPVTVVGRSMKPTLLNGEYGFTNRFTVLTNSEVKRGEIVVITMKNEDTGETEHWVKRVIGLPGETISCKNETIYIDGKALDESDYINESYRQEMIDQFGYFNMDFDEVTLDDDEYFVMGDNRPYSKDSRYADVGPIKKSQIFGEGVFVLLPLSNMGMK
ncbi:signal peptidase I [Catenisphaera adipataccumulans]|jgi:signal peptidase I|uniref:Signal peptidase I n=1 Tax=Catenisphaera adipataccumulans TaxID=700500 RepID=A0A7W8FXN2_9FIRM|nr:signal peptidase I [Catenisphaera adipataccumulans]MBB5183925.1 signal peptidase I [Catenisphaera adipataccumulans]